MTLLLILAVGAVMGVVMGLLLRRVGLIRRISDLIFGMVGAFITGAMGSNALLTGLTRLDLIAAAVGAAGLVAAMHLASAMLRPVHGKYYRR